MGKYIFYQCPSHIMPLKSAIATITIIAIMIIIAALLMGGHANTNKNLDTEITINPMEMTDADVALALNNTTPLVLGFYYPGCGHCKFLNNTTSELSNELQGQIRFGSINVKENRSLQTVKKYKVSFFPTLLFFDQGLLVSRMKGNISKFDMLSELKEIRPDLNTSNVRVSMTNATAEDWLQEGNELFSKGLFDLAIQCFDKSIKLNPNYAYAWSNKCSALGYQGSFDEAVRACDEAINLDPELIPAWMGKGSALTNLNQADEAIKAFDKAISLDPNIALAWAGKSKALNLLNRTADSEDALARARELGYTE